MTRHLHTTTVPLTSLPGVSALFKDYIEDFESVSEFYAGDYRKIDSYRRAIPSICRNRSILPALSHIIAEQNAQYSGTALTRRHIDSLAAGESCAVVTGQQPGLFGGPLYTLYKTLTTIKLAQELSRQLGRVIIPVFWLASEDHDLDEINRVGIIDQRNQLRTIRYRPTSASPRIPVSAITLDGSIDAVRSELCNCCPETEFKATIMTMVERAYAPGRSLSEAFALLLAELARRSGLVLIDPSDPRIKSLGRELIYKELSTAPHSSRLVANAGEKLQRRGYHVQVKGQVERANLFWLSPHRHAIVSAGESLFMGKKKIVKKHELEELVERSPHLFSPNVILRPVLQDYLLPTLAYVAGPAEIAYFAQLKGVYADFDVTMPLIYPRASMTLIEPKLQRHLDRLGITLGEVWAGHDALLKTAARRFVPENIEGAIARVRMVMTEELSALSAIVRRSDPSLPIRIEKTDQLIQKGLSRLESRLLSSLQRQNRTLRGQISALSNHLFPDNCLQERVLNIIPLLIKYSTQLLGAIAEAIELWRFDHRILLIRTPQEKQRGDKNAP